MNENEKNNELYNTAMIEKYLQGKLTAREMHAIEKAALDDPFLADAIEGVSQAVENRGSDSLQTDVAELRQRLKQRITQNKKRVVPIISFRNWWQVAAVFFILAFSGTMTYYYIRNNLSDTKNIAQENKQVSQPKSDTIEAETGRSTAKETDSTTFNIATQKKPKSARTTTASAKNTDAVKSNKDTTAMNADVAMETEQQASKRNEPVSVEKNDDKSAPKASSGEYFAAPAKQNSFMGRVTDQYNKPIPSASVQLEGKKIAVVTDNNGNFKLNIKDPDSVVVAKVVSNGYMPALTDLSNNGSANIIILREDKSNLQEVVTTGMNTRRKYSAKQKTTQDAVPLMGWDEYNKYLEKNKKTPQDSIGLKGPVVVSFLINKKGTLSNFAIEQSLGPGYDEEAIRLIREGPAWKLLKGKKANINVIVNY